MDHPPAREIFPPCLLHLGTEVKSHFQNECEHSQRWTLNCVLFILILELLRYVLLRYQISTGFSRRKWPPPTMHPPNPGTLRMFRFPSFHSAKPPAAFYLKEAGPFEDPSSWWLFFWSQGSQDMLIHVTKGWCTQSSVVPRIFNSSRSIDQQREVVAASSRPPVFVNNLRHSGILMDFRQYLFTKVVPSTCITNHISHNNNDHSFFFLMFLFSTFLHWLQNEVYQTHFLKAWNLFL